MEKNTVQCKKSGASAALHRNAVLICCSRYSVDLGPSVSALCPEDHPQICDLIINILLIENEWAASSAHVAIQGT